MVEKVEIVKNGADWNDTLLCNVVGKLTDDNFEFKGNYIIKWEILKDE